MEWLNYHHLLYFWTVAREGSLTRAAKELRLTQQTVSAQIRSLEDSLGEKLFERQGPRPRADRHGTARLRLRRRDLRARPRAAGHGARPPDSDAAGARRGGGGRAAQARRHRLIRPALAGRSRCGSCCREGKAEDLLAPLAVQTLDVVLSDTPLRPGLSVRAFNHQLGECGVSFLAERALARKLRRGFPQLLDGAPVLLPTEDTVLRRSLDQWFERSDVRPRVVAEFEDSALLKVFGQHGEGIFAGSRDDRRARSAGSTACASIGPPRRCRERFYAISVERRIKHPAVAAITERARGGALRVNATAVPDASPRSGAGTPPHRLRAARRGDAPNRRAAVPRSAPSRAGSRRPGRRASPHPSSPEWMARARQHQTHAERRRLGAGVHARVEVGQPQRPTRPQQRSTRAQDEQRGDDQTRSSTRAPSRWPAPGRRFPGRRRGRRERDVDERPPGPCGAR